MADVQTQAGGTDTPGGQAEATPSQANQAQSVPQSDTQTNGGTGAQAQPAQDQTSTDAWRAARDAEVERLRQVAQAATATAEQERAERVRTQRQAERERLSNLDPEEKAAAYERLIQQREAEDQQQREAQQRQAQMRDRIWGELQKHNEHRKGMGMAAIDPSDARLDFSGNTPEAVLASVMASLGQITLDDASKAIAEAKKANKREVVTALNEAGVTQMPRGDAAPAGKAAEIRKQMDALRGTGRTQEYMALKRQLRTIDPQAV